MELRGTLGADAAAPRIHPEVVKLPNAKRGFVLLPRRWAVERSFASASRLRRLARHYERAPETFAGLHFLAIACRMLHRTVTLAAQSPYHALGALLTGRNDPRSTRTW